MDNVIALSVAEPVHVETAGRFGDWREPLTFDLPGPESLAAAATAHRLDPGVALTLLVERALLLCDLDAFGHDVVDARFVLGLEAAEPTSVVLGPGRPNAGYARSLGGVAAPVDTHGVFSLPARILERVDEPLVRSALCEAHLTRALGEALAWERAAVAADRLMAEWALLVLLAATR
jgi:hypothetical protein